MWPGPYTKCVKSLEVQNVEM